MHNMMKIELKIITLIKITIMKMRTMAMIKRSIMITVIVLALVFFSLLWGFLKNRKIEKRVHQKEEKNYFWLLN